MKLFLKTIFLFLLVLSVSAQEKAEREESIRESEVPIEALSFVNKANFRKKVRWYREYGLEKESVEAKVKFKKHLYSIEFDKEGKIEDIEMTVKRLPHEILKTIENELKDNFTKSKILRIQLQWLHSPKDLIPFFNHHEKIALPPDGYEMEVEGFSEGNVHTYEVTSNANGHIISILKYVLRPTDNLDF